MLFALIAIGILVWIAPLSTRMKIMSNSALVVYAQTLMNCDQAGKDERVSPKTDEKQ